LSEVKQCLTIAQEDLRTMDPTDHDYGWEVVNGPLPEVNSRLNVPHIPGQKAPGKAMPRHLANCRRNTHLEVASADVDKLKALVAHGKKIGVWKEMMGVHIHPTETVNWDSTQNDRKHAAKFHRASTNFNASMAVSDVHGFGDINDKVAVRENGVIVQRVSGRMIFTTLLRFGSNNSTLVAEVHQAEPNGLVQFVHPNIPDAEGLFLNMAKNPAAFLSNYMPAIGIDPSFVQDAVRRLCNPATIHEALNCKWIAETNTILTPEEQDEDEEDNLESQEWYVDIVAQFNELGKKERDKKGKNYTDAEALYDLDGERSVKRCTRRMTVW
jgi:hypothetical protein